MTSIIAATDEKRRAEAPKRADAGRSLGPHKRLQATLTKPKNRVARRVAGSGADNMESKVAFYNIGCRVVWLTCGVRMRVLIVVPIRQAALPEGVLLQGVCLAFRRGVL